MLRRALRGIWHVVELVVKLAQAAVSATVLDWTRSMSAAQFASAPSPTSIIMAVAYPLDTVRRQLQVQHMPGKPRATHAGMRDAFARIWRSEGLAGFYRGFLPNLVKAMPGGAGLWESRGSVGCLQSSPPD